MRSVIFVPLRSLDAELTWLTSHLTVPSAILMRRTKLGRVSMHPVPGEERRGSREVRRNRLRAHLRQPASHVRSDETGCTYGNMFDFFLYPLRKGPLRREKESGPMAKTNLGVGRSAGIQLAP